MNDLIPVNTSGDNPTVSGRDLHAALMIETRYNDWFPRMADYGFEEGKDYCSILSNGDGFGKAATKIDHEITLDMAKEIAMIQRTDKGKAVRQYFLELEKKWNDPVSIMARALQYAERQIDSLKNVNAILIPKADFYDAVIESTDTIEMATVAKIINVGIGRNRLINILKDALVLRSNGTPYQKFVDNGWLRCIEEKYEKPDGSVFIYTKTVVYQKGVDGIRKLLKEKYALGA